jgi:site-specific DNA recombinase
VSDATLYGRVSTAEQAEKGLSIPAQLEACRRFCSVQGWTISSTHQDEGVSASLPLDRRPGLLAAIAALELGSVLLVAKRDRIFRADPFECVVIERAVVSRGARIVSAAGEGTGDDEPSSVLMRELLDSFARYELRVIRARTRAVLRSKAARSERIGQVPWGTRLAADGLHVEPDHEELRVVEQIQALRAEGRSLRWIADALDSRRVPTKNHGPGWAASSVAAILRRFP